MSPYVLAPEKGGGENRINDREKEKGLKRRITGGKILQGVKEGLSKDLIGNVYRNGIFCGGKREIIPKGKG